jgi:sialate O-acetylesterase
MKPLTLLLISLCFFFNADPAQAQFRVANIFSDNMVIQRDHDVIVWGWGVAGQKVSVSIKDDSASAMIDASGRWEVALKPIPASSTSFSIVVESGDESIECKNVLAGDVWICSGQSNMEWTVQNSANAGQEISNANYPLIRHVKIDRKTSSFALKDATNGGWQVCSPKTAGNFTAVGYFFGRELHEELEIPIGLINSSWGGTIIEAWISGESLKTHPDFKSAVEQIESLPQNGVAQRELQKKLETWNQGFAKAVNTKNEAWSKPGFDDSKWKTIRVPGQWEGQGYPDIDGVGWYRKTVDIPESWAGKDVTVALAKVDDADVTFANGRKIGELNSWDADRRYRVEGERVQAGPLSIAVRVTDGNMGGGIYGAPEELFLAVDDQPKMSLAGEWKFRLSPETEAIGRKPKAGFSGPNHPTVLHNAMIAPLHPIRFKGAIWYQGESNAGRGFQYRSLMKLLIKDWRSKWGTDGVPSDFPFYWVQLANFTPAPEQPGESSWAELREAQTMALSVPGTGQAVAIDIGEANDIHPKNKQEVGRRLALNALAKNYGKQVEYSGPVYREMKREGNQIRLLFDYAEGLEARGGKLKQFAIAGADKKFVWADAKIDGDVVVVSSPEISEPVAVRYAWAHNPAGCNLYNGAGLPASPFRTDDWKGVTER